MLYEEVGVLLLMVVAAVTGGLPLPDYRCAFCYEVDEAVTRRRGGGKSACRWQWAQGMAAGIS